MYGHGDAAERLLTPPPRYPIPRLGRGRDPVQAADLVAPPSIVVGGSKHTIVHEPTLTEGAGLGESRNTAAETERDRLLHPELGAQMSPFIVPQTVNLSEGATQVGAGALVGNLKEAPRNPTR